MTANMYRVGDYVYFETSSTSPYQIRRIEELNKTAAGNVEAKVMCFYRRRDLPSPLIQLADKHQSALDESSGGALLSATVPLPTPVPPSTTPTPTTLSTTTPPPPSPANSDSSRHTDTPTPITTTASATATATTTTITANSLVPNITAIGTLVPMSGKQRHQMKHRELFLSRQVETLPATHIRGKCSVTLFNETESLHSYLSKDDMFFYCLVFDPTQKTLLADKGEIRVGSRYQTDMTSLIPLGELDPRDHSLAPPSAAPPPVLETLVWTPEHGLSDRQIDQFLVVSRSVGTFARALDCSSSVKQPSLHMSAAAASRDITLFHAMDTLHKHVYNLSGALCSLVPSSGPVLCRDEMEEWSASEANLFEEALDKYGKDFNDIRHDFLPWKTLKNIVEYYYMWKTTDRYVQQKRVKAVEAESKLKQVYIPNYNKGNTSALNNNKGIVNGSSNGTSALGTAGVTAPAAAALPADQHGGPLAMQLGKACESCNATAAVQWYAWGPSHLQCRLCPACWQYWKRYGGLKVPSRFPDTADPDMPGGIPVPLALGGGSAGAGARGGQGATSDGEDEKMSPGGGGGGGGALGHRPHRCTIPSCGKEFKLKAHLGRHYATAHGMTVRSGSPRPIMKTRTAFYLRTTPPTRVSRRLCRDLVRPRHAARAPFYPINIQAVKQEFALRLAGRGVGGGAGAGAGGGSALFDLRQLLVYGQRQRGSVTHIANRLGNPGPVTPQWLLLTARDQLPQPGRVAFPRPPKAPDGSLLYERVPNKPEADRVPMNNAHVSPSLKRRHCDDVNGIDSGTPSSSHPPSAANALGGPGACPTGPPTAKRLHKDPHPTSLSTHHHQHHHLHLAAHAAAPPPLPPHHRSLMPPSPDIPQQQQLQQQQQHLSTLPTALLTMQPSPHHHLNPYPAVAAAAAAAVTQHHQQQQAVNTAAAAAAAAAAPPAAAGQMQQQHQHQQQPRHIAQINGKAKVQHMRSGGGRKQVISLMDAPDDLYFRATESSKKLRRQVTSTEMRRIARKPWRGAPKSRDQLQPQHQQQQQQQQQQVVVLD